MNKQDLQRSNSSHNMNHMKGNTKIAG